MRLLLLTKSIIPRPAATPSPMTKARTPITIRTIFHTCRKPSVATVQEEEEEEEEEEKEEEEEEEEKEGGRRWKKQEVRRKIFSIQYGKYFNFLH